MPAGWWNNAQSVPVEFWDLPDTLAEDSNNSSEFAALPGSQWGPGGDPVLLCPQSSGRRSRRRAARAERRDRTRRSPAEMTSTSMTTRSALGQVSTQRVSERERLRGHWRLECLLGIRREEKKELGREGNGGRQRQDRETVPEKWLEEKRWQKRCEKAKDEERKERRKAFVCKKEKLKVRAFHANLFSVFKSYLRIVQTAPGNPYFLNCWIKY